MKNSNEFRIGCCGARIWSLVIGWLQTIFSALGLVAILVFSFVYAYSLGWKKGINNDIDDYSDATHPFYYAMLVIVLIFTLMEFIGGIFLILGVEEQNLRKIKVWKVLKIITVVVTSLFALVLLSGSLDSGLTVTASILVEIFFIWAVGVHQQELLATTAGFQNL